MRKNRKTQVPVSLRVTERRTEIIIDYLMNNCDFVEMIGKYGEPGYSDPEKGILFADWNNYIFPKWLGDYLEQAGYALEWSDEWYLDYDWDKAYRTSGNSWFWQSQIAFVDGDVLTPDDSVDEWIEAFLNSPELALPERFNAAVLMPLGFTKWPNDVSIFENGWHPGQTDDPHKIFEQVQKDVIGAEVLFVIPEVSQFYIRFECWVRSNMDCGNYRIRSGTTIWTDDQELPILGLAEEIRQIVDADIAKGPITEADIEVLDGQDRVWPYEDLVRALEKQA